MRTRRTTNTRRGTFIGVAMAFGLVAGLSACGGQSDGAGDDGPGTTVLGPATTTTVLPTTTAAESTATTGTVTDAEVVRLDDGALLVRWTGSGPITLRLGSDGTEFPEFLGTFDTSATGDGEFPLGELRGRAYVRVEAVDGTTRIAAERRVPMVGALNFRDLGGYQTVDGRRVRWGQVFRSGALADLTDDDLDTAVALGIKLVCDLRSDGEVAVKPDPTLGDEQIRLAVSDDSVDVQAITDAVLAGDLDAISPNLLLDGMPRIATEFDELWSDLLRRLTDPANRPTNVHCSAGKDRAGWASALVLRALGVPEETVMADYLLSNEYLAEENARRVDQVRTVVAGVRGVPEDEVDLTNLVAVLDVRAEYLRAAFDAVESKYGSFDAYLNDGLGLTDDDLTALRDSLLE
jgi:protein-tyrosine phosphatase